MDTSLLLFTKYKIVESLMNNIDPNEIKDFNSVQFSLLLTEGNKRAFAIFNSAEDIKTDGILADCIYSKFNNKISNDLISHIHGEDGDQIVSSAVHYFAYAFAHNMTVDESLYGPLEKDETSDYFEESQDDWEWRNEYLENKVIVMFDPKTIEKVFIQRTRELDINISYAYDAIRLYFKFLKNTLTKNEYYCYIKDNP